jgi:hypothetical protein
MIMTHRLLGLGLSCLIALHLAMLRSEAIELPGIPDAGQPVSGAIVPAPGGDVSIVSHKGEWSSFASMEGDAEPIFLITGQLKNTANKPLTYVKIQFELLDEDGVAIVRDYGYNRKAEALREEAYESGKKTLKDMEIEPLAVGGEDSFRFLFFKADIPKFRSYRIRILESQ